MSRGLFDGDRGVLRIAAFAAFALVISHSALAVELTATQERCPFPFPESELTDSERFMLEEMRVPRIPDLAARYPAEGDALSEAPWPEGRVLRASFLAALMTCPEHQEEFLLTGVHVRGAVVREMLDVSTQRIATTVGFSNSRFEAGLHLQSAKFERFVLLLDTRVRGEIMAAKSKFAGEFAIQQCQIDGLMLDGAQLRELNLLRSQISHISGVGIEVGEDLDLSEIEVKSAFFTGAVIAGDVQLRGAHSSWKFKFDEARIAGDVMLGMSFDGEEPSSDLRSLSLSNAHIDGSVFVAHTGQAMDLSATGVRIGGRLHLYHTHLSSLSLSWAHVSDLYLSGVDIDEGFYARRLSVDRSLALENVATGGLTNLADARVGGELSILGGVYERLDLARIEVGGELRIGAILEHPAPDVDPLAVPEWSEGGEVDLRGAHAVVFSHVPGHSWPPNYRLSGFRYDAVLAFDDPDRVEQDTHDWIAWLDASTPYVRSSYTHHAELLRDLGHESSANATLYASRDRERRLAHGLHGLGLTIQWLVTGYGLRAWLAAFWIIGLVAVGAAVLRASGEGLRHKMPYGLSFSLDLLLPVLRLRPQHYEIDLAGWPRYYFYVHQILGYVLAGALIAEVSGWVG